jgi:hypothetical protein
LAASGAAPQLKRAMSNGVGDFKSMQREEKQGRKIN